MPDELVNPVKDLGSLPLPPPAPVNLDQEYVSGGSMLWSRTQARSLPWSFDDITADFGDDLYERMLLDPQVAACIGVLKTAILEDGLHIEPAIDDEDDPQFARAREIADFCREVIDNLDTPIDDVLWDLLDALALGSRVAEEIYRDDMRLKALKVKPRRATAFVVDAYMNVVGLLGLIPGQGYGVVLGTFIVGDPSRVPHLLPREKFAVLSWRPKNADPRGRTLLRPAYGPWWLKQQVWPEYLKYLAVFATPSLVGTTAERATTVIDPTTGQPVSAVQGLLNTLLAFKNNSAMAVPYGTEVEPIQAQGDGAVFREAIALLDRQITTGIVFQTLATMEGEHQARAAAQTHRDVLDTIISQARRSLCGTLRRDVLRDQVRYQFGEEAARALTPRVSLGAPEGVDLPALMTAISNLERAGYLAPSQKPAVDSMLGLPVRLPGEAERQAPAAVVGPPPAPAEGDEDEDEDEEAREGDAA